MVIEQFPPLCPAAGAGLHEARGDAIQAHALLQPTSRFRMYWIVNFSMCFEVSEAWNLVLIPKEGSLL
jgi:hypothetical protein